MALSGQPYTPAALLSGKSPQVYFMSIAMNNDGLEARRTGSTVIYRDFHLKCNPNYNSVFKLWWHLYIKTNE
jgi:hypothetical protein